MTSRTLLSRKWILAHAGIALFAGLCIVAGRWQLQRMTEHRAFNASLAARERKEPEPLGALITPDASREQITNAEYRRITAQGTFDPAHEIFLEGRSLDGRAGRDVLTPLAVRPGVALIVDRGWIPIADQPIAEAAAPRRSVDVTGILFPRQGGFGTAVPKKGPQPGVSRVDPAKLAKVVPYRLLPLWLHMQTQDPPQASQLPVTLPISTLNPGQNLSYAIQWFSFASIALLGYAFFVRTRLTSSRSRSVDTVPEPDTRRGRIPSFHRRDRNGQRSPRAPT